MKKIIIGTVCLFLFKVLETYFCESNYSSLVSFINNEWRGISNVGVICVIFGFCFVLLREQDKAFWEHEKLRERRRKERIEEAKRKGEDPKDIDWYESNF